MEVSDMNEILAAACVSIESGFDRVMIDPQDVVAIIDQHHELLAALEAMCEEFRGYDLPYGSVAYRLANIAINKAKGT